MDSINEPKSSDDDPYELFSTPPNNLILSSTPNKPARTKNETKKYHCKKRQKSENPWDKCIKTNPELAEFVDKFNQSLAEALSKPLDMAEEK